MDDKEFFTLAKKKYGDKISVNFLSADPKTMDELRKYMSYDIKVEDFIEYGEHAWLLENICPECGAELLGLFGSFEWGMPHGEGFCSHCEKVTFRYYHYIIEGKKPITMFSLIGFDR